MRLIIQQEPFGPGALLDAFVKTTEGAGAVVTFTGVTRSLAADPVLAMTIECYPELAVPQIKIMMARAVERFDLLDVGVLHRHGRLLSGEPIMQVMTAAAHRRAAFEAAEFLMDYLKTAAPFWKREETTNGARWVEAQAADDDAAVRWSS
jgi:molybdopterin synthase catalytic subunit